jgi:hypothetical protein
MKMGNADVLLAFLWAAEQGLLTQVHLVEMPESLRLNHQCELAMSKIRKMNSSGIRRPTSSSMRQVCGKEHSMHQASLAS